MIAMSNIECIQNGRNLLFGMRAENRRPFLIQSISDFRLGININILWSENHSAKAINEVFVSSLLDNMCAHFTDAQDRNSVREYLTYKLLKCSLHRDLEELISDQNDQAMASARLRIENLINRLLKTV